MSVINTNVSATLAANAILRNDRAMGTAMERLSTGLRINSAKDDAAGLAISTRMKAEVSGLEMAAKNANDAISMLEVAEGATLEISNMLIRMRELAVQSASGTYSDNDRGALDLEFGALMSEIERIATNTTWNTMSILNGDDRTMAHRLLFMTYRVVRESQIQRHGGRRNNKHPARCCRLTGDDSDA